MCETYEKLRDRVAELEEELRQFKDIAAGEELTYDYNLTGDPQDPAAQRREYPCNCGSANCRGTMFKIE